MIGFLRVVWFCVWVVSFFCSILFFNEIQFGLAVMWVLISLGMVVGVSLSRSPEKDEGH